MAKWLVVGLIALSIGPAALNASQYEAAQGAATESATDRQIQKFQDRVKRFPDDYSGYDSLGSAFLQKARETGDIAYYDLSEKALKQALDLAPQDFRAADPLVHMSLVYMGEHRFPDALSSSRKAVSLGSGNLAAFAVESDAYADMGDYDEAAATCEALRQLGTTIASPLTLSYVSDSRLSYLAFLHGDSKQAIQLMKSAIAAALQISVPSENLAWLYFELGERYFQTGDLEAAETSYQSGIASDPNHYRSLAGLARVRAAQDKLEDSIKLYQRSIAIIPFPAYIEELGDVYQKAGNSTEAQQQYDLVVYIGHLSKLNQVLANRELALFYANQGIKLPEAVDLVRRELEARHDIYTWDALAWTLYKNGRLQEASEASDKALGLHTDDSLLLFHAGMICYALKKYPEAERLLTRALATNPHFHLLHAVETSHTLEDISQSRNEEIRTQAPRSQALRSKDAIH